MLLDGFAMWISEPDTVILEDGFAILISMVGSDDVTERICGVDFIAGHGDETG